MFTNLQDDMSDEFEPEKSEELKKIQKNINSLADEFSNKDNGKTEDDVKEKLNSNLKNYVKLEIHSLLRIGIQNAI